jgi:hypothetical protein
MNAAPVGPFGGIPGPGIFIAPMGLPFIPPRGFRGALFPLGPLGGSRLWLLMRSVPCCGRTRCRTESFDRSIALEICPMIRPLPPGCLEFRMDFGPVGLFYVSTMSIKVTVAHETYTTPSAPPPESAISAS